MSNTYQKTPGSAGSKGVDFQISLLSVFMLNALRQNIRDWKLSTENKSAGKLDDVVLELSDGSAILLQAKHKENKKITLEQLLSTNPRNEDFSLPKYFLSYLDVRTKFSVKFVVICTNTQADENILEFLNQNSVGRDSMLHSHDEASFFTFSDGIVPDLITNARVYHTNNLKGRGVAETLITEENAKEFLKHLQLYLEYPSGSDLEKVTENLLHSLKSFGNLLRNISYRDLHQKVKDWFEHPKGEYLTESRAQAMFCEIKSERYREGLEDYKVFFNNNDYFNFVESENRILHVVAEGGYILQLMKVYRDLQHSNFKILYTFPDQCKEVQVQVIKAFELPVYTHLVIALPKFLEESITSEIYHSLTNILRNREYKKVIFVAEHNNKLVQRMKSANNTFDVFNKLLTLEDLSADTQTMLLQKKCIIFQGEETSLEALLPDQTIDDHKKYIKSEILEKLVKDESIVIGRRLKDLKKDVSRYYVRRKFEKNVEEVERATVRKATVFEEDIYNVDEKIVLISDSAGTGKTTVLTNMSTEIKRNNPRLWVARIELNDCTKILRDCLKNRRRLNVAELLKCEDQTKATEELETVLFSLHGGVVLILDGVDEISPDYTQLIIDLLVQLNKSENVAKAFVSTRPHIAAELEVHLRVTSFALAPLTEQNQVEFFTNYWTHNLKVESGGDCRCERYARKLINKMSAVMTNWQDNNGNEFVVIPLHARMLAEVFLDSDGSEEWEGCKEYLSTDEEEPKLPDRMNIAKLYGMFIEKKKDIFMDKGNPSGNTMANQALMNQFQECLAYHRSLALEAILHEKCVLFPGYRNGIGDRKMKVLQMGIVQKLDNVLCFVHRTFAEYFVAESVFGELLLANPHIRFQKFLLNEVFTNSEFNILRHFLDNFLQNRVASVSADIFESYMSLIDDTDSEDSNLIHRLAGEGNTEIIRLLLKCIDFEPRLLTRPPESKYGTFLVQKNALTVLQYLVEYDGINIKDDKDRTPLHWSVIGGHLDTVKFLVQMGANPYSNSEFGGTALHLAVESGRRHIIEFLLDIGMDVNVKDEQDRTVLYYAVERDSCDIIRFLVDRRVNIHLKDYQGCTALHLAAQRGTRNTVQFLVELGMDVNITDRQDRTALHYAAETGNYDIVHFLVEFGMDANTADRQGCTALHLAAKRGSRSIVEYLVAHRGDVNVADGRGRTALHLAVLNGGRDTVEFLVRSDIKLDTADKEGRTALHFAAELGRWNIVKFLVELGMDVNVTDGKRRTSLHYAAERGDCDIVDFLVEHEANTDTADIEDHTAFHLAVMRPLVKRGVDINMADKGDRTALHMAVKNDDCDTVDFLLKSGIDFKTADGTGYTPLHSAAFRHSPKIVELLLNSGADVNTANNNGRTALHCAFAFESYNNRVEELLLEHGADIDIADAGGNTVLHLVVEKGRFDFVKYLATRVADINVANKKGETALHFAVKGGNFRMIELLLEHGADVHSVNDKGNAAAHFVIRF